MRNLEQELSELGEQLEAEEANRSEGADRGRVLNLKRTADVFSVVSLGFL